MGTDFSLSCRVEAPRRRKPFIVAARQERRWFKMREWPHYTCIIKLDCLHYETAMRSNPYNPKNWLRFLTKRVVPGVLLFVILAMTPFEVRSGLVYTFSQVDAGVQLTCSGNLNPGGMEFGGYFTDDGSYINANPYTTCYVQYAEGFFSTYDTQQASVSWQFNLKPGFYSVYYSSWGDFFGLRIFAQSVVAVVPYQYTPGTPIN